MSFIVSIELGYEFDVKAKAKTVFDVLADVPTSASFFPNVQRLVDLGDGAYRWEMAKIGLPQINLQTIYASRYASNKAKRSVVWTPVEGVGNAQVSGNWAITDKKTFTRIQLHIQGELQLPLPALMKPVLEPAVVAEFERMVEQYIDNLAQHFGGEVQT